MKKVAVVVVMVAGLALCSVAYAAGSLSGTYETKVQGSTWTIAFKTGGYTVYRQGRAFVQGRDSIKGSKISLTDTGGAGACPGTGTYRFESSGKTLTFTRLKDSGQCTGREAVLSGTFTKIG